MNTISYIADPESQDAVAITFGGEETSNSSGTVYQEWQLSVGSGGSDSPFRGGAFKGKWQAFKKAYR